MRKQVVEHTSPLDALIGLAKRLAEYEIRHGLESEDFFNRYTQGKLGDDAPYVEWANDYRHYLAIRRDLEERLRDAAYVLSKYHIL